MSDVIYVTSSGKAHTAAQFVVLSAIEEYAASELDAGRSTARKNISLATCSPIVRTPADIYLS